MINTRHILIDNDANVLDINDNIFKFHDRFVDLAQKRLPNKSHDEIVNSVDNILINANERDICITHIGDESGHVLMQYIREKQHRYTVITVGYDAMTPGEPQCTVMSTGASCKLDKFLESDKLDTITTLLGADPNINALRIKNMQKQITRQLRQQNEAGGENVMTFHDHRNHDRFNLDATTIVVK